MGMGGHYTWCMIKNVLRGIKAKPKDMEAIVLQHTSNSSPDIKQSLAYKPLQQRHGGTIPNMLKECFEIEGHR